jgi:hypothetical protein
MGNKGNISNINDLQGIRQIGQKMTSFGLNANSGERSGTGTKTRASKAQRDT